MTARSLSRRQEGGGDDLAVGLPRGLLAQAHARDLGVRIGHLRHHPVVARARPAQDVVDDELRFVGADMREQQLARRVAGGPHVAGRGAHGVVEHRLSRRRASPRRHPDRVRPARARARSRPAPARPRARRGRRSRPARSRCVARALDRGAREDRDPLGLQRGAKSDGRVLVLREASGDRTPRRSSPVRRIGHRSARTRPRSAHPDHDEGRREAAVMPDRLLVRPVRAVAQPVDRRKRRPGPAARTRCGRPRCARRRRSRARSGRSPVRRRGSRVPRVR